MNPILSALVASTVLVGTVNTRESMAFARVVANDTNSDTIIVRDKLGNLTTLEWESGYQGFDSGKLIVLAGGPYSFTVVDEDGNSGEYFEK